MNKQAGLLSNRPLLVLFFALAVAYIAVMAAFLREGHPKTTIRGVDEQAIHIDVHLLNVDLTRELATFTFSPDMTSGGVASNGRLSADIVMELDTGTSVLSHTFKKGDAVPSWSASVPLQYGDPLEYPFDRHGGEIFLKVLRAGNPSPLARVDLDKIMHGFVATAQAEPTEDKAQMALSYEISRSPAVLFLALVALISLSLVIASAVNVAKQVAVNGRKVEFGMMVWIAALLFVIPAVRNGLPGSPPYGATVDVGLFFWLHVLGVGSLLTVVYRWTRQAPA